MTAEERIASLEEQLKQVLAQLRQTQEELAAAYKRIEELEKQKMPPAAPLGQGVSTRDNPGGGIRNPDREVLAGANSIIKGAHCFLDWRVTIPDMDPIQIDVVGTQALQAGLKREHEILVVIARGIGVRAVARHRVLGCHHKTIPASHK